jgi:hypothetical protein
MLAIALGGWWGCAPPEEPAGDVDATTAELVPEDPAAVDPLASTDLRDVPGAQTNKACVHEVPLGAAIDAQGNVSLNGKTVAHYPPCAFPVVAHKRPGKSTSKGRIEDDSALALPKGTCDSANGTCAGYFDGLQNAWTVPSAPSSNGGLIYLYNALASKDGSTIVEAVLQYGNNGFFGGNSWTVSNWVVTKTNVYYTKGVEVAVGDSVGGFLLGADCSKSGLCDWQLQIQKGRDFPDISAAVGVPLVWAFKGVLEAFHINACSKLPASGQTTFDLTMLFEPDASGQDQDEIETSLSWSPKVTSGLTPSCSYKVTDTSSGAVLHY